MDKGKKKKKLLPLCNHIESYSSAKSNYDESCEHDDGLTQKPTKIAFHSTEEPIKG